MADNPTIRENTATAPHPSLSNTATRACAVCSIDLFRVEDVTSNAGAKGVEGLIMVCANGHYQLIDFEAMGATANYV